jgi:hypothetical protein
MAWKDRRAPGKARLQILCLKAQVDEIDAAVKRDDYLDRSQWVIDAALERARGVSAKRLPDLPAAIAPAMVAVARESGLDPVAYAELWCRNVIAAVRHRAQADEGKRRR